jgi:hypothetical protein
MNTHKQTRFPRTQARIEAGLPMPTGRTSNVERRTSNLERDRGLAALSREEADELSRREGLIKERLDAAGDNCRDAWRHLRYIQTQRLYREDFHTFADYCRARWRQTARHIMRKIEALGVEEDLADVAPGSLLASTPGTALPAAPGTSVPNPARARSGQGDEHPGEFWRDFEERSPKSKVQGPKPEWTEKQLRPLVPLAKEERRAAVKVAEELAGPGKVPTAKQVEWAVKSLKFKVQSPPLMADREPGWVCGTPGPEWLALGAAARKQVLEASQRARVAIRDLQDLLPANARYFFRCSDAVAQIDAIEADLKGPEVSTQRREDRGETQQKGRPKGTDGRA